MYPNQSNGPALDTYRIGEKVKHYKDKTLGVVISASNPYTPLVEWSDGKVTYQDSMTLIPLN